MRTNLLRFMFDSAWRFDAAGNELYVGAGWLILVWTLVVCVAAVRIWRSEGSVLEALLAAGFWLLVPGGFLGLLLWQPDIGIVRDGFPVFGYGFMMFVGFSTASWLAARRIRSIGVDPDVIWDMLMWALIPGLIGGADVLSAATRQSGIFHGGGISEADCGGGVVGWRDCVLRQRDRRDGGDYDILSSAEAAAGADPGRADSVAAGG